MYILVVNVCNSGARVVGNPTIKNKLCVELVGRIQSYS